MSTVHHNSYLYALIHAVLDTGTSALKSQNTGFILYIWKSHNQYPIDFVRIVNVSLA